MMKKIVCSISFMIFFSTSLLSQQIGDQILDVEGKDYLWITQLNDFSYNEDRRDFTKRFYNSNVEGIKQMKKGSVYKLTKGDTYLMAELKKKKGYSFTYKPVSDIKYIKNDAIFAKNNFDEDGNLVETETLYHPNGNIYKATEWDDILKKYRRVKYGLEGNLVEMYTDGFLEKTTISDPAYGQINEYNWSKFDLKPNMQSKEGILYVGHPHIGSLYTKDNYILTGFHFPMNKTHGNGSVLFLENAKNANCFWTVIIDGKIRELEKTNCNEKPNIEELYQQTKKQVFTLPKHKDYRGVYMDGNVNVANIYSKDIQHKNGYGIYLKSSMIDGSPDAVEMKVGFFKDGKLNGMGYQANLSYYVSPVSIKQAPFILVEVTGIKWNAKYGYFDNNIHKAGAIIYTDDTYKLGSNVYDDLPYSNFMFKEYNPSRDIVNKTISFNDLLKNFHVYSTKLNRVLEVISLDYTNKTITVKADKKGTQFTFNSSHKGEIYGFLSDIEHYNVSCPPTVTEDNYVYENVPIFSYGGVETSTRRVNGVYYDKIITETKFNSQKVTTVYSEKLVKNGTKQVKCPKCDGKGYIAKSKQNGVFCEIEF